MRSIKPNLRAIFISGYAADPAKLAEVLETESLTFIQKPFSPKVVAQKVREVLGPQKNCVGSGFRVLGSGCDVPVSGPTARRRSPSANPES